MPHMIGPLSFLEDTWDQSQMWAVGRVRPNHRSNGPKKQRDKSNIASSRCNIICPIQTYARDVGAWYAMTPVVEPGRKKISFLLGKMFLIISYSLIPWRVILLFKWQGR